VPGSRRPPAWPVLLVYAVAFFLTLAASTGLLVAVGAARTRGSWAAVLEEAQRFAVSGPGLAAQAVSSAAVLAGVAAFVARREGHGVAAGLRLGPARGSAAGFAAAIAGMIGLSLACGAATDLVGAPRGAVMDGIAQAMKAPSPGAFVLAVVAIGAAPGVAEEAFFRGWMQRRLAESWGPGAGVVGASLAFGLIHVDPVHATLAFVAGLFLGWVAQRLGGIRPTMWAHGINNAMFVALASLHGPDATSRAAPTAVLAAGALVCAASVAVLSSRFALRATYASERARGGVSATGDP
jgi:membrane protease YdiL (CAAX protease family)